jgi:hypothetical protein
MFPSLVTYTFYLFRFHKCNQSMADLLEGLGDTGNQSGESALPGALGLSVESAAELFSKDSGQDFTKLLKFVICNSI